MANEVVIARDLPEISVGTASVTNGQKTVTFTGVGAALMATSGGVTTKMIGRGSRFIAAGREYSIASLDSATQITLDEDYAGTTNAAVTFKIRTLVAPTVEVVQALTSLATRGQVTNPLPDLSIAAGGGFNVTVTFGSTLSANRTLNVLTGDASRTVTLGGNFTAGGAITFSGAYSFTGTLSNNTAVTFPVSGTLASLAGTETLTNKTIRMGSVGTSAHIAMRSTSQTQLEWGNANLTAGYIGSLGAEFGSGQPFIAMGCAGGSGTNTYQTFGTFQGSLIKMDGIGGWNFYSVSNPNANNQTPTLRFSIGTAAIYPGVDNTYSCGTGSFRFSVVYAGTGTINTSDETQKHILGEIDVGYLLAAFETPLVAYQWKDAREAKGDDARIHFGPTAQGFRDACLARGVDPRRIAAYCEDPIVRMVARKKKILAQKRTIVLTKREIVQIRGGVPVLTVIEEETPELVFESLPIVDERGVPVKDETGAIRHHMVPVMEEVEIEEMVEEDTGEVTCGLRLDQFDRLLSHALRCMRSGAIYYTPLPDAG